MPDARVTFGLLVSSTVPKPVLGRFTMRGSSTRSALSTVRSQRVTEELQIVNPDSNLSGGGLVLVEATYGGYRPCNRRTGNPRSPRSKVRVVA